MDTNHGTGEPAAERPLDPAQVEHTGGHPRRLRMAPLRPSRSRCPRCGREGVTLWAGLCGWCTGTRPDRAEGLGGRS